LPAFESPIAYARSGVHGNSGSPRIDVRIGPCSVEYSLRVCGLRLPSACLTCTVTSSTVISFGCPS